MQARQGIVCAVVLCLVLGIPGCATRGASTMAALPPPPGDGAASFPPDELALARATYLNKCARCHKFHNPADYSQQNWDKWMAKMSRKAKLKPPEEELLSRYLALYRSGDGVK